MLKTFSMTDVGRKRQLNQDFVFTSDKPLGNMPNLFIVADGMGGHNAGDFASRYAVETIVQEIKESFEKNPTLIIKKAIEKANENIRQKAGESSSYAGMGTTVVVATVIGKYLQVANVGDSRLYIINKKEIRQITKDHSLVEEMVRLGGLERTDARVHPDKNIITRAIGAKNQIEVDFFTIELHKDDYVLMCSDGLSNMVEDEEIRKIVLGQRDLVEGAQVLVDTANNNGGKDNIAVILIKSLIDREIDGGKDD